MKPLIPLIPTISWERGKVKLIDQTQLPLKEDYILTDDYETVCNAIHRLSIRGAPAIGVAGVFACVLAANHIDKRGELGSHQFISKFRGVADKIKSTRPTAVNLGWGVDQCKTLAQLSSGNIKKFKKDLLNLAQKIKADDIRRCDALCNHGSKLIKNNSNVITICNTGGLATSGIGTALGVIQYAHARGSKVLVHVCETRPLLQGARLNTWELKRTNTPFTLMTDSMAAQAMKNNKIDGVFVGADRIASNGDTANKIGTYSLAVLAKYHDIPFYVAAPLSTVDFNIESGNEIPIEQRDPQEITRIHGSPFTTEDFDVTTPAFDVTPAELIDGIITEKGVAEYPYTESLK